MLLGGLFFGARYWWKNRSKSGDDKPIVVRIDRVALGDLAEVIQAQGEVEPRNKVGISARVAARIVDLPYKEGDTVTRGNPAADPPTSPSVLVKLDSTDLQASLRSSQARYAAQMSQLEVSKARIEAQKDSIKATSITLADAERELVRQQQLMKTARTSQVDLEAAQRKVDELKAQASGAQHTLEADQRSLDVMQHNLEAADADIMKAKDNLSYAEITSPIDGVVTKLNAKVGELVITGTMNNPGTMIMEVADLSQMLVVARVDETDVASVKPRLKCDVHIQAYPEKVLKAVVETVALTKSSDKDQTKHYRTEILLEPNGERILCGLTADVDIQTTKHLGIMRVPSQAVLGRAVDDLPKEIRELPEVNKDKTIVPVVYRIVKDKSVVTPVSIGASDLTHTMIKSGLKEGDRIIVGPYKILEAMAHDKKVEEEKDTTGTAKSKSDKKAPEADRKK